MQDLLQYEVADSMQGNYVCAGCYGHLVMFKIGKLFALECPECGEGRGYVRKEYAEKRKAESQMEMIEARWNLAGVFETQKRPLDVMINELFG